MWKKFTKIINKLIKYIILISVLLSLIFIIYLKVQNDDTQSFETPLPPVKIQKPKIGSIEKYLIFSTYIEAKDIISIIPFIQGKILEYNVEVGDYVYKDQIIAIIDSASLDQQVLQAQAAYNAYKSTFDRIAALYKNNATTAQNYDEAKAKLDASKAQLELIKVQRDYSIVRSPIFGTIISAPYAKGNIASSKNPIAVVANLESQVVNIEIDEKYYDIIYDNKDNLIIELTRPQSSAKTSASLISIDPYINSQSKTFILSAKLIGNLTYFRPGMYSIAKITYQTNNNLYILDQKIKKLDGSIYYYSEKDQCAHYLDTTKINNSQENDYYFSIDEKYKDTYFIVEGENNVNDGQKVKAYKMIEE